MEQTNVLVYDNFGNNCVDTKMKTFEKLYDGESIYDVQRDVIESFDARFNPMIKDVPQDEYGFQLGTFRVTIEWFNDE